MYIVSHIHNVACTHFLFHYSYSLYEPKYIVLSEYKGGLEKAILKNSTLLVQLNDAFCKTHPWLAQKVCTSSAHAHIAAYGARHHERRSNGNRADFRRQW